METKAKILKKIKVRESVYLSGQYSSGFIHPDWAEVTKIKHEIIKSWVYTKSFKGKTKKKYITTIHCGTHVFRGDSNSNIAITITIPKAYQIEL